MLSKRTLRQHFYILCFIIAMEYERMCIILEFENRFDPDTRTLYMILRGEMDHHGAASARAQADALIDMHSPSVLIMDMSHIAFCDSSGLGLIMGRYKKIDRAGGTLRLLDPTPAVLRIMTLSGLDKIINVERSKQNAKA